MSLKADELVKELNNAFDIFNKDFFENKLNKSFVSITTVPETRNKSVLGYINSQKFWSPEDKNPSREIVLTGLAFNEGRYEVVFETLLHEMVHQYCLENNIKDVEQSNNRHNKNFKLIAETKAKLLVYKPINKNSGYITGNSDFLISYYKTLGNKLNLDLFCQLKNNFKPKPWGITKKLENKKNYSCKECGYSFKIGCDIDLICKKCGKELIKK